MQVNGPLGPSIKYVTHMVYPVPQFETSQRGKPVMVMGDYRFTIHSVLGPRIRWQCAMQRKYRCNAKMYTIDNYIIKIKIRNKPKEVQPRVVISDSDRDEDDDNEKKEKNDGSEDKSLIIKESDDSSNCSSQLYGKSSGEPMILLKDGIYCTKKSFDDAIDFSRKSATSFLRRIADGVFRPVAIQNCTYSGRPPNAQGPERQSAKVEALDRNAKKAIIEFCEDYAFKEGWPRVSPSKMRRAMSQWIGEKKRKKIN